MGPDKTLATTYTFDAVSPTPRPTTSGDAKKNDDDEDDTAAVDWGIVGAIVFGCGCVILLLIGYRQYKVRQELLKSGRQSLLPNPEHIAYHRSNIDPVEPARKTSRVEMRHPSSSGADKKTPLLSAQSDV